MKTEFVYYEVLLTNQSILTKFGNNKIPVDVSSVWDIRDTYVQTLNLWFEWQQILGDR
jgi:hypothetical protein